MKSMKAIVNGRILLPDREVNDQALLFDRTIQGVISRPAEGCEIIDAGGDYVSPGFVDVHIHGYLGADASDGEAEGLKTMAEGILRNGVTSFLPTTMTIPWKELEKAFQTIREVMPETREEGFAGAEIMGCHAEGPFINPAKKGAQEEGAILPPEAERILPYADIIRLITVAPEMPGAIECIEKLGGRMAVSIGHTNGNYKQIKAGLSAGANHFTHLFNAMTGLHHRDPGAVGAALSGEAWCELIADTFHVNPELYPLLDRCQGERLVLITDCTRAGGLGDGQYTLGGQPIWVEGIACRLKDGTIAGSVLKMNEAVRNYRDYARVPMYEAAACASTHPAESVGIGERKGSLLPGRDADILILNENCTVRKVFRRGRRVF